MPSETKVTAFPQALLMCGIERVPQVADFGELSRAVLRDLCGAPASSPALTSWRTRTSALRAILAIGLIGSALLSGGCGAAARVQAPLTSGPLAGNDAHEKSEFWYQLARRPAVSNDEAFHALLLYFSGNDP